MITVVLDVVVIFATRASRLMPGGVIPASTGRNVVSVGCMHPVIIRSVIQCNVQFFSVGAATPDRRCILSDTVDRG